MASRKGSETWQAVGLSISTIYLFNLFGLGPIWLDLVDRKKANKQKKMVPSTGFRSGSPLWRGHFSVDFLGTFSLTQRSDWKKQQGTTKFHRGLGDWYLANCSTDASSIIVLLTEVPGKASRRSCVPYSTFLWRVLLRGELPTRDLKHTTIHKMGFRTPRRYRYCTSFTQVTISIRFFFNGFYDHLGQRLGEVYQGEA